jgi:precorrin-4/cobalt-precorrin-4 C11-methyltransferase
MSESNTVYFVGSGPGDPELITLKAKRLVETADVIIYSGSLMNPKRGSQGRREEGPAGHKVP